MATDRLSAHARAEVQQENPVVFANLSTAATDMAQTLRAQHGLVPAGINCPFSLRFGTEAPAATRADQAMCLCAAGGREAGGILRAEGERQVAILGAEGVH